MISFRTTDRIFPWGIWEVVFSLLNTQNSPSSILNTHFESCTRPKYWIHLVIMLDFYIFFPSCFEYDYIRAEHQQWICLLPCLCVYQIWIRNWMWPLNHSLSLFYPKYSHWSHIWRLENEKNRHSFLFNIRSFASHHSHTACMFLWIVSSVLLTLIN